MVFSSMIFLWMFLPIVIIGYYVINDKIKNSFLLLASLLFYFWGEPQYVFLMIASIIINWGAGLLIEKFVAYKRLLLVADILVNLLLLGYFKYFTFFLSVINGLFDKNIPITEIALPIGISFFIFQILSYVIDLYRGEYKAQKNIVKVALYVSFFPQLIAGPIVKYKDIIAQLDKRQVCVLKIAEGIRRFIYGLGKKVIIANSLAHCVDTIYGLDLADVSGLFAWIAAISYSLQIYYDFSGYSDMAIGLGKIFGFEFQENFHYPYLSLSIKEFWQRWHISLGTWFREYVYIPLGGNRKGKARTLVNLFIVFLLTGLWHGANYTFIVWGLWHGFFSIVERMGLEKILRRHKLCSYIYTLCVVTFGWVLFRADSLSQAKMFFLRMLLPWKYSSTVSLQQAVYNSTFLIAILGIGGCGFIQKLIDNRKVVEKIRYSYLEILFCTMILLLCFIILASNSYNPFIYFRF